MIHITIICVGKIKESFYRNAVDEYVKRLSTYCKLSIKELPDEATPDKASSALEEKIRSIEGSRILAAHNNKAHMILLDIGGKTLDSVAFSKKIEDLSVSGVSDIEFIIGGSLGVSAEIRQAADYRLSFSPMTFPHQLMRVILLEQIYRGFRISKGEPYHK